MSAVLRWLGGGAVATSLFVVLNCCLTYGSFSAVSLMSRHPRLGFVRTGLSALIILNPVIFCYVGIVWKDVLFATWLVTALTLSLIASRVRSNLCALAVVALSILVIGVGPLVRQQGILIAPIILLAPTLTIWLRTRSWARWSGVLIAIVFCGCIGLVAGRLADKSIKGNAGRDMAVGPSVIALFDVSGVIARLPEDVAARDVKGLTATDYSTVQQKYTPTRADFLNSIPELPIHLNNSANGASMLTIWRHVVLAHPGEYLRHRIRVMLALLDIGDLQLCVPTHVGIDGQHEYLSAAGLVPSTSKRAQALYKLANSFFGTPVWRNWFYAVIALCVGAFALLKKSAPNRPIVLIYVSALLVFIVAFGPTAIACDFRYLYPIIPALSVLLLFLLNAMPALDDSLSDA
ncbi:hypothetical protein [Paraburkholderia fungorum]|nr:hypothetical protein [Paraburkholderia fungorum]USU17007.1 hypothetical protein NFE55_04340 [Paraburkholderia fungorum]USU24952.1 hypothetical protein NFS19_04340 [Paraburkholderia fungorum]